MRKYLDLLQDIKDNGVALELLKELREEASQEYWCTEKEHRSSIHTTLNRIDDAMKKKDNKI